MPFWKKFFMRFKWHPNSLSLASTLFCFFFIASSSYAASLSEIRKQSCYPLNKNVDDLNSVGFVYKEFKKETSR